MMGKIRLIILVSYVTVAWSADSRACDLNCRNGGVCRLGKAEFGYASQMDDEDPIPFAEQDHNNNMHCQCPPGYTGLQCEIVFKMCGENQHTCSNGADCVRQQDDFGGIYFHCECDVARTDFSAVYAGHLCQHAVTVFCSKGANSSTPVRQSFCVNGGRCKEFVEVDGDHKGCECGNDWFGPHCEFFRSPAIRIKDGASPADKTGFALIGIASAVIMAVIVAVALWRRAKKTRETPPVFEIQTAGARKRQKEEADAAIGKSGLRDVELM